VTQRGRGAVAGKCGGRWQGDGHTFSDNSTPRIQVLDIRALPASRDSRRCIAGSS
jgi:hypothetical protein